MILGGVTFLKSEDVDNYATYIYPYLPIPSNLQIYAKEILNKDPNELSGLVI